MLSYLKSVRTGDEPWRIAKERSHVTGGHPDRAAVANAFHREGAQVVIVDVNAKDGEAVAKGLGKTGSSSRLTCR
jgi:hypothetical protein